MIAASDSPAYISAHSAEVILSDIRPIRLRPDALRCINVLLDEVLWDILNTARALTTDRLNSALRKVLPTSLGKEALLEAEVELRAYLERVGRAAAVPEEDPQDFNAQYTFQLLRLKCEAYSTMNDTDEDVEAEARLHERMGGIPSPKPGLVAPAALYLTAILESVCEHILSIVGRVAARDSSRTLANVQDLFVALCEDDQMYSLFKTMKVYEQIERMTKTQQQPHRTKSISQNSERSGSRAASPLQDHAASPRHQASPLGKLSGHARGSSDGAKQAMNGGGSNGGTRAGSPSLPRSSLEKAMALKSRLTPGSRTSSDQALAGAGEDKENGYTNGVANGPSKTDSVLSTMTKQTWMAFNEGVRTDNAEDLDDDGSVKDFDDLMRSGSTMKMSLTPDRLRTMEVYNKEKNRKGKLAIPSKLGDGKPAGSESDTSPSPSPSAQWGSTNSRLRQVDSIQEDEEEPTPTPIVTRARNNSLSAVSALRPPAPDANANARLRSLSVSTAPTKASILSPSAPLPPPYSVQASPISGPSAPSTPSPLSAPPLRTPQQQRPPSAGQQQQQSRPPSAGQSRPPSAGQGTATPERTPRPLPLEIPRVTAPPPSSFTPTKRTPQPLTVNTSGGNGLPPRKSKVARNASSLDLDDVMNGSEDEEDLALPAPKRPNPSSPASSKAARSIAPPRTPVSKGTRELMDFLAEGPPEPPFPGPPPMPPYTPNGGGASDAASMKSRKSSAGAAGGGRLHRMMSRLTNRASVEQLNQRAREDGPRTPIMPHHPLPRPPPPPPVPGSSSASSPIGTSPTPSPSARTPSSRAGLPPMSTTRIMAGGATVIASKPPRPPPVIPPTMPISPPESPSQVSLEDQQPPPAAVAPASLSSRAGTPSRAESPLTTNRIERVERKPSIVRKAVPVWDQVPPARENGTSSPSLGQLHTPEPSSGSLVDRTKLHPIRTHDVPRDDASPVSSLASPSPARSPLSARISPSPSRGPRPMRTEKKLVESSIQTELDARTSTPSLAVASEPVPTAPAQAAPPAIAPSDLLEMRQLMARATSADECRLLLDMFLAKAGIAAFDHATEFNVPAASPVDPPKAAVPTAEPVRDGSADCINSEDSLVEFLLGGNEAPARRSRPSKVNARHLPVAPLVPRRVQESPRGSPDPSVSTPTSTSSQLPIVSRVVGVGA